MKTLDKPVELVLCGTKYTGVISRHEYQADKRQVALCFDDDEGENICILSVCAPHESTMAIDKGTGPFVCIKNWSENEGVLEQLVALGIVEDTGVRIPSGFVQIPLCVLKDAAKKKPLSWTEVQA